MGNLVSEQTEKLVLAHMIAEKMDPSIISPGMLGGIQTQRLFNAYADLYGRDAPINPHNLVEEFGNEGYFNDFYYRMSHQDCDFQAELWLLRDIASKRNTYFGLDNITKRLADGSICDVGQLNDEVGAVLSTQYVRRPDKLIDHAADAIARYELAQMGKLDQYMATGIPAIDAHTKLPKNLTVIAARPSQGKSTFMINLCITLMRQGKKVGMIVLEDDQSDIIDGFIANLSRTNNRSVYEEGALNQSQMDEVRVAAEWLKARQFMMPMHSGSYDTKNFLPAAKKFMRENDVDVLMIDHLQKIIPVGVNIYKEYGNLVNGLQDMCKGKYPLILFAQCSRKVEEREGFWPIMSDLRESGDIEQAARVLMFLNRPEAYLQRQGAFVDPKIHNHLYAKIEKVSRGGTVGVVPLGMRPEYNLLFTCRCSEGIFCNESYPDANGFYRSKPPEKHESHGLL